MNRKEIVKFCNDNIFNQVICPQLMTRQDMIDTVKMVANWRIGKKSDIIMQPTVVNNFLFMNGEPVGRIAPAPPRVMYSKEADYWENRILAKCGL